MEGDNINQDKQKLLKIMQELEKDYKMGKISEDKYKYLSKEYKSRLANLNASTRIRHMQGKESKPPSPTVQRSMAEASRREDRALVNKYIVKTEKERKEEMKAARVASNKGIFAIIAVVFLISAFLVGISFGLFAGPQNTAQTTGPVFVSDSAFPQTLTNSSNADDSVSISGPDTGWIEGSANDGTSSNDVNYNVKPSNDFSDTGADSTSSSDKKNSNSDSKTTSSSSKNSNSGTNTGSTSSKNSNTGSSTGSSSSSGSSSKNK